MLLLHNEPTDAYTKKSNRCQESAEKKDLITRSGWHVFEVVVTHEIHLVTIHYLHHLTLRTIFEAFFPAPQPYIWLLLAFTTTLDPSDSVFTKATGCCRRLNSLETHGGHGVHTVASVSSLKGSC